MSGNHNSDQYVRDMRATQNNIETKVHELTAIIEGKFGYPGLRQRITDLDTELGKMRTTQESLERDHQKRIEDEQRKRKYMMVAIGGIITIISAVMATIIGVFVQTGLGG